MKLLGQASLLAATTIAISAIGCIASEAASDVLVLTSDSFAQTVDAEVCPQVQR
jgi:hypothetical protein